MKKQSAIIGNILLIAMVALSGCNSPKQTTGSTPEDLIIGHWHTTVEDIEIDFEFSQNHSVRGTVQGTSVWSKYELTENQIIFTNPDGTNSTSEYSFSNNNQKITLTSQFGDTMILTKQ